MALSMKSHALGSSVSRSLYSESSTDMVIWLALSERWSGQTDRTWVIFCWLRPRWIPLAAPKLNLTKSFRKYLERIWATHSPMNSWPLITSSILLKLKIGSSIGDGAATFQSPAPRARWGRRVSIAAYWTTRRPMLTQSLIEGAKGYAIGNRKSSLRMIHVYQSQK